MENVFVPMPLPKTVFLRMQGRSYPQDCGCAAEDLRYFTVRHYDFAGAVRTGELVCAAALADELCGIFYRLYRARYPLAAVRLVDDFDADDERSMAANNSSCFNWRVIKGTNRLSAHSLGRAVDINPLFNPYINRFGVDPPGAACYADRTKNFAGKIDHDDLCFKLFTQYGWEWGGDWQDYQDYQHFEKR